MLYDIEQLPRIDNQHDLKQALLNNIFFKETILKAKIVITCYFFAPEKNPHFPRADFY